jgi:pimeloyl-ACP methyl ester carboxylesterase
VPPTRRAGTAPHGHRRGRSKSPAYLRKSLTALDRVLPHARRVTLDGVGHLAPEDSGQPQRVAEELRTFFASSP